MQSVITRLAALARLARPLTLTFIGIVALSLGFAYVLIFLYRTVPMPDAFYYLSLQFLPLWLRGVILLLAGFVILGSGIWKLSGVAVIPVYRHHHAAGGLGLGYERAAGPPQIAVISGGAGLLIPASLGRSAARLTCITPVQDPVEYYSRASSLFNFENVIFVAPTPEPIAVEVVLDDGTRFDIKENIAHIEQLSQRHVADIRLKMTNGASPPVTQATLKALREAHVIILGPGSLFEGILPDLLIPDIREAIMASHARKLYICSLMTEPGMTTGFGVGEHIRQIARFGGFTPDYVLVNAQRIDADVRRIYAAANQNPVFLSPEEYEETIVQATDRVTTRDVVVEGAIVIEADLASSVVQLTASLDNPGEGRTVRVLRHDPEKLIAAITEVLRRG
ncbi:MAG TPA: 2-phospho-L-lactate transferase CofD family protein [Roseiflexaceae bacterium]|nr:2-phospho-L-lactate transferase CofD family protein [Roseiflexaceae bacterium]